MVQSRKRTQSRSKKSVRGLVSVILPTYNAARTLGNAINSILTQTYKKWELIIIDDGSVDNTLDVVKQFADKRIRYFSQLNSGIVAARNRGNDEAVGEFCVVQDADDFSFPDRLEKCVKNIGKADVLIHSAYINAWNEQYKCVERRYAQGKGDIKSVLRNQIQGWPFYRRSVWVQKPFRIETQFSYDWMMHLDWMLSGFKYKVLDEALYEYVRYLGSASDRFERSGKRAESFKKIKEIVKREYARKVL